MQGQSYIISNPHVLKTFEQAATDPKPYIQPALVSALEISLMSLILMTRECAHAELAAAGLNAAFVKQNVMSTGQAAAGIAYMRECY